MSTMQFFQVAIIQERIAKLNITPEQVLKDVSAGRIAEMTIDEWLDAVEKYLDNLEGK